MGSADKAQDFLIETLM